MPRETLDHQIHNLMDEILLLGKMVENATLSAVDALKRQDLSAARSLYDGDRLINEKRFEIENQCIATIATQQPIIARDLRLLSSILDIASEVERMGDYAKGIAKICLIIGNQPLVKPLIDIPRMAKVATNMLQKALGAFVSGDLETARSIPYEDDEVDALYNQVYRELVTIMFRDPSTIDQSNYLMWAAHNLERLADRVTNLCERTIYYKTGKLTELDVSDDEQFEKNK